MDIAWWWLVDLVVVALGVTLFGAGWKNSKRSLMLGGTAILFAGGWLGGSLMALGQVTEFFTAVMG